MTSVVIRQGAAGASLAECLDRSQGQRMDAYSAERDIEGYSPPVRRMRRRIARYGTRGRRGSARVEWTVAALHCQL